MSTKEHVLDLMRRAVEIRGEKFVYSRKPDGGDYDDCWYVREGQPDCLIGLMAHLDGVPLETLAKYEGVTVKSLIDGGVVDWPMKHALFLAQQHQDEGWEYGEILKEFERSLQ